MRRLIVVVAVLVVTSMLWSVTTSSSVTTALGRRRAVEELQGRKSGGWMERVAMATAPLGDHLAPLSQRVSDATDHLVEAATPMRQRAEAAVAAAKATAAAIPRLPEFGEKVAAAALEAAATVAAAAGGRPLETPRVTAANVPWTGPITPLRFLIVSMQSPDEKHRTLYAPATAIKRAYAARHGYDFRMYDVGTEEDAKRGNRDADGTATQFKKVVTVNAILNDPEMQARYDYLFWIDGDVVIQNGDIRLERFVQNPRRPGHAYSLIMVDHTACINNGGFFFRFTDWSRAFVRDWLVVNQHNIRIPFTDNGSMYCVMLDKLGPWKRTCCEPGYASSDFLRCTRAQFEQFGFHPPHDAGLRRQNDHMWLVPAEQGFNNHEWIPAMDGWGWKVRDTFDEGRDMFAMHTKQTAKWAARSHSLNKWPPPAG